MDTFEPNQGCPRCDYPIMKAWDDLSDDDRFVVERIPGPHDVLPEQRKKHRFCKRCFFEDIGKNEVHT